MRPDNPRISQDILIPADQLSGAQAGQIVWLILPKRPLAIALPQGRISEVLGDHLDPGLEIEVSIRNYGIPHQWNDDV